MGKSGGIIIFAKNFIFQMRFIGDYTAKTDAKGRVFLPAALRKIMEAEGVTSLVLREDTAQHCLVLYPEAVWNAQFDMLKERINPFVPAQAMMLRKFALGAEPIELDSNGRLLLSKRKLEYAGIGSDVRFLGVDDRIELWDKDTLEKIQQDTDSFGDELGSLFM